MNIIHCIYMHGSRAQFSKSYMYGSFFTVYYHMLFYCVHGRYDTINSHLTQIFMCATVNVKTMLLDFFDLHVRNYQ